MPNDMKTPREVMFDAHMIEAYRDCDVWQSVDDMLAALDAAGYEIVRKKDSADNAEGR